MANPSQKPNNTASAGAGDPLVLSGKPAMAMQEMMVIIDALKATMQEETRAVQQNDTQAFIHLQDQKMKAAGQYQEGVRQMIARKEEMRRAPGALKDQLAQKRAAFMDIAQENLETLERMRTGMQRLSERIMRAAKKEAEESQKFVYGSHGKLEGSGKASMGVNESA